MSDAKIIRFINKRGRPKNNRPLHDTGTPETVMKKLLGITTESLDICLERGIINRKQHWCGIHLRWLYTLRYGIPSVKSTNLTMLKHSKQLPIDNEDPQWRKEREQEYSQAINLLNKTGYAQLIINICIYNERPKFLNLMGENHLPIQPNIKQDLKKIQEGLDILANLWKNL